ncbi:MAG: (Fe-S)-binding protein [Coriobacteriales bacterium]|jgi:fumarate reductase (CoM/CoB) subunit B
MNSAKFWSVLEKGHYPFRAWPRGACASLLFCGCSFMSQYPRTTDALVEVCRAQGCGVAYDCCGLPVDGFGERRLAARVMDATLARVRAVGCDEVVFVCPNCMAYLAPRLQGQGVRSVTIYEKLAQWGFDPAVGELGPGVLFTPCPDRRRLDWRRDIERVVSLDGLVPLAKAPCCGLMPKIAAQGPERVRELDDRIFAAAEGRALYTYCASCAGQFARAGYRAPVVHVLAALLGTDEAPDAAHAIANRARRAFDRRLEPCAVPAVREGGRGEGGVSR